MKKAFLVTVGVIASLAAMAIYYTPKDTCACEAVMVDAVESTPAVMCGEATEAAPAQQVEVTIDEEKPAIEEEKPAAATEEETDKDTEEVQTVNVELHVETPDQK